MLMVRRTNVAKCAAQATPYVISRIKTDALPINLDSLAMSVSALQRVATFDYLGTPTFVVIKRSNIFDLHETSISLLSPPLVTTVVCRAW